MVNIDTPQVGRSVPRRQSIFSLVPSTNVLASERNRFGIRRWEILLVYACSLEGAVLAHLGDHPLPEASGYRRGGVRRGWPRMLRAATCVRGEVRNRALVGGKTIRAQLGNLTHWFSGREHSP